MNLPNKLTVFRIVLVPIMLLVSIIDRIFGISGEVFGVSSAFLIMGAIFIIASITDHLDGQIARKTNQITTFGKFLDPIADKILVLTALIIFVEYGKMPAWVPVIVMFREFLVSGFRLVAAGHGTVIPAAFWGKVKTATQMVGITLFFFDKFNFFAFLFRAKTVLEAEASSINVYMTTGEFLFNIITSICILVSVIACIFSGWEYLKNGKDLLKD